MTRPRTQGPTYELSDAEKRDLVHLIQAGKPLPEKYRFLLFDDKREVELVWNGKTRDVCTTVLPFQSLEHVDEPRQEAGERRDAQLDLFDKRGRQLRGWTNKLIWGDNRLILSSLKSGPLREQIEEAGGITLIYIDPPFDVGADFSMDIEVGGETFHKEPNLLEQVAYRDTWGRGADSYLTMIYERLVLMRDLLHTEGSIYVHCDWRLSAGVRSVLDEVFGVECFQNEIIWCYREAINSRKRWNRKHDNILFFTRDPDRFTFNADEVLQPHSEATIAKYRYEDEKGSYRLMGRGIAGSPIRSARDVSPEWEQKHPELTYRHYLRSGTYAVDYWQIDIVNQAARERLGFPTQKPEALLERVLKASTGEGELVADFFCGSGTTAAVAEKLGRKWICADLGKFAIHTTRKRMIQVQRELKAAGQDFRAFEVLNLGRYERQAYLHVGGRLTPEQQEAALARKERDYRELILCAYKAEPLQDAGFFHGKRAGRLVVVGPINLPAGRLVVEEIVTECRKRGATRVDLLAFEFEMGLFPAALDEAKGKGIDLLPKYIPPEVFDKRAVDKGDVVFFDIAFVEATPRYQKKDKLALAIELTDYSVYYTQGQVEELIKNLKNGKNGVVCDRGKLVKVSKDKGGVVSKEVLTKSWTDWVDYWAVDFDYESRKEIIRVPKGFGLQGYLEGVEPAQGQLVEYEQLWTGGYLFENEWQSFRTRRSRDLELFSAVHVYDRPGRYIVAVKVIDLFGNDTMTLVPVTVG